MNRPRARIFVVAALGAALLIGAGGVREDELACEEAVAHLVDCCPGFPASQVDCHHIAGCDMNSSPVLAVDESECIGHLGCDSIRARGLCATVPALRPPPGADGGAPEGQDASPDAGAPRAPVCQ